MAAEKKVCENCVFAAPASVVVPLGYPKATLECRLDPPAISWGPGPDKFVGFWPLVEPEKTCGKWGKK